MGNNPGPSSGPNPSSNHRTSTPTPENRTRTRTPTPYRLASTPTLTPNKVSVDLGKTKAAMPAEPLTDQQVADLQVVNDSLRRVATNS